MEQKDSSLEAFEKAMKLFGEKDLTGAASLFEKVIAETDGRHLRDRARQFLNVCHQQTAGAEAPEDDYLAAVFQKNQGNLEAALGLCESGAADDERFVYLKASIKALAEEAEEALELLEKAIGLEPKNRVYAFHDPDFESLRGTEGFTGLINPPKAEAS